MHNLEPFYNWRHLYTAENDERSPFFEREYSEFEYTHAIYNYLIHPQWDDIESETLYIKIIFVSYEAGFCIIELIGEWNDAISNDIMLLKRDVIDVLLAEGINKFLLIGENILNFHNSDDSYYEEWYEEVADGGWIAFMNFREHVMHEFEKANIDYYVVLGGKLNEVRWRTYHPMELFEKINSLVMKRLGN